MAVLYTNTFATEHTVDSVGGPTFYEISGIPFDTFGTGTLRLTVTADLKDIGGGLDDGHMDMFVAPPAEPDMSAVQTDQIAHIAQDTASATYVNLTMMDGGNGYIDFTGPGTAQSLYFFPTPWPPGLNGSTMKIQNVVVTVEGTASTGYSTDLNPFNFEKSVTQWRTQPKLSSSFDGSYVFALGYDGTAPNIEEIAIGDYIQVAQAVTVDGVGVVRAKIRIKQPQSMPDRRDVSTDFQLIAESATSPGNKVVIPAGVTESDVGRYVTVTGCTNVGNNTTFKIVGIQDSITAFVDQVTVTEGPRNGTIVATEAGARWKLSLLVDDGATQVERARVIQDADESGFYRTDFTINVSKMSGIQNIYFRMTLIEHDPNNFYAMP